MADFCTFCETRRPQGGTNMLILNNGTLFLEFCQTCGDNEVLTNQDGKHQTVKQIFDGSKEDAPKHLVLRMIAMRNIKREAEFKRKKEERKEIKKMIRVNKENAKARREAKRLEREAKANSLGNICPELKALK